MPAIKYNCLLVLLLFCISIVIPRKAFAQNIVLQQVTILLDKSASSVTETAAAELLASEVQKRTGIQWQVSTNWPSGGDVVLLKRVAAKTNLPVTIPLVPAVSAKEESFRIVGILNRQQQIIVIEGTDERGLLFGVGQLLRLFQYQPSSVTLAQLPAFAASPDKSIRGHQLGYRNTANSYDGWTKQQFEQYIKDLVVFGTNSIESIPIFDESTSPHFKEDPMVMNAFISSVCKKYALDYWMWIPAQFDLKDSSLRKKYLTTFEKICKQSVTIKGVFFPGGDPGDNPPQLVIPLLQDIAVLLKKYHPHAKTWLSLQGFTNAQSQYVYRYIQDKLPDWLGGLITGPSSPTVEETRAVLPARYPLRHYPDVTHNVRCEFEIPWWDPAFNFTLGREAINPRPYHYAAIYRAIDPYIDGFISYSDGVHDDVNKIIWTALGWNRHANERDVLKEYSNYFFGSRLADVAADGILALEKNWQGPIASNGSITATYELWSSLEKNNPSLDNNWRWQMNLLRASYDAYVRERYIYETKLEQEANTQLAQAATLGSAVAIKEATDILQKAETAPLWKLVHEKIIQLCEALYQSISLQTSVQKYKASGLERGAVLDFIDRPLNNRWWLEDEFNKIQKLSTEADKVKALERIANWENVAPGSFYDEVGNIGKSPHELKGEDWKIDPMLRKNGNPGYDFSDNGFSRKRLSWLTSMHWPLAMEYTSIDTTAAYTVRIAGVGESLLKINGQRIAPSRYGREAGDIKEFPVPQLLVQQGKLILTWDDINEDFLNWRNQSRVSEVWLIKEAAHP